MSAIVSLISLIISLGISKVKSMAFHVVFIFLAFATFAYTIAVNPTLDDIRVYSDSLENIKSKVLYFEYTFVLFLNIFHFFDFDILYPISVGLSASLTYWILCTKFKRSDNLHLVLFFILYTPQFSLAWRQLLATPAFTYIIINFLICYDVSEKPKIFKKIIAVIFSSFHNATLLSAIGMLVLSHKKKIFIVTFILFVSVFIYNSEYFEVMNNFFMEKSLFFINQVKGQVKGASNYIDYSFSTAYRSLFVNLKFLLLLYVFIKLYHIHGYANVISIRMLGALCVFKVILSLLIWIIPSPAWGRINGLLIVVDYVVLIHSLRRYPLLSLCYLFPSYIFGITLHPFFR